MIRSLSLAVLLSSSAAAPIAEAPTVHVSDDVPEAAAALPYDVASDARERVPVMDEAELLYEEIGLDGVLARDVFLAAFRSLDARGLEADRIAVADMSQPSTERRLYVLDVSARELVLRTFVAHGSGTGGLMAERFSNVEGSHQTSLGLYRVGREIVSPKHGPALLLQGLDPGVNDRAREREIIVHGADYVSEAFIAQVGRLGRSWGCPAVPREDVAEVIDLLADDGFLYVHGA